MTDLNLDRMEELEQAATEGPWEADCCSAANMVYGHGDSIGVDATREDAEFIAEMRNATPALLARVRELEATVERVRAIHERDMVLRDYCSECSDFGSDQFPPGQMVEWPCQTVAALDGAPEPEEKP